jgi:M6 family metalloprotease-like protein
MGFAYYLYQILIVFLTTKLFMKLKNFLLVLIVIHSCFAVHEVFAVQANPNPVSYEQPDGSKLTIILKGDEFIHWATTVDGYMLLSNRLGFYEYAVKSSDGQLTFSGLRASEVDRRSREEMALLQKLPKGLFFSESQIAGMKQILKNRRAPNAPVLGGFPTTGVNTHLEILANFSNTTTTYTQANFTNLMNQANYNGTGSFKDYYLEVSYGQLTVNTTVTVWVTLPHTHDYYGPDSMWGQFAYDAIVAADQQAAVNFSGYDNNFDGIVDGICVVHQGRGQEESGNTNDIWSHSWDLVEAGFSTAQRTFDGVQVLDYTTIPEKAGSSSMSSIGVMCHEFGHNLGTPDFYDTDYSTGGSYDGTGEWDVMAGGSWNGSPSGSRPPHPNPWIKTFFNWVSPTILTSQQPVLLRNMQSYPDIVRYNTATANEYFLCENRQLTGFNASMPGHGMVIYHVDGNFITAHQSSNDINCNSHQGMYPMAANSTTGSGIMSGYSSTINTSGCPWPGTTSKTTFTDATTPNSKSWAGANTNAPLTTIAENTSTKEITFCFINCSALGDPSTLTATTVSTSQINLTWTKNTTNDPVMVAYSLTGTFGTPVSGTVYSAGNAVPGGGTVLYNGTLTAFSHTGLNPGTVYYYKAWSVGSGSVYSTGIIANASTFCNVTAALPFTESFSGTTIPMCWSQMDNQGNGQIWQFGTITGQSPNPALSGNYAYLDSDGYGTGNTQNADLITPTLDLTSYSGITLQFSHYFEAYSGSSGSVSYSINNGSTWTLIQTFTATTSNPAVFNQAIAALAGQSQVKIKWNYTGTYGYFWAVDDVNITGSGTAPTLNVSPLNRDVTAASGSTNFSVTSNSSWTVNSDQTWCLTTPSGTGNGTIAVNYEENISIVPRIASITTVVTGLPPQVVTVTQSGATPTLSVTPHSQNVTAASGTVYFSIETNATSWTANCDVPWCSVTPSGTGSGTLSANFQQNANSGSRTATITVTIAGATPQVVTVVQDDAVGVEENPGNGLVLFPNPATGFIRIVSNRGKILQVEMEDLTGRTVQKRTGFDGAQVQIDLSSLPDGIYFARIRFADTTIIRRLIISR